MLARLGSFLILFFPLWSCVGKPTTKQTIQPAIPGHLYVVATPIEDTRRARLLLNHFDISSKQIISHHMHSTMAETMQIADLLKSGKSVALTTDAGTPGISDPGAALVKVCHQEGIPTHPVPGASALTAALSISAMPAPVTFYGFVPRKPLARAKMLAEIMDSEQSSVLYESPHRVLELVQTLVAFMDGEGDKRECFMCRELTKIYEESKVGTLREIESWLLEKDGGTQKQLVRRTKLLQTKEHRVPSSSKCIKGEFCLVLGPSSKREVTKGEISRALQVLKGNGIARSVAVKQVTKDLQCSKRAVYAISLAMDWIKTV